MRSACFHIASFLKGIFLKKGAYLSLFCTFDLDLEGHPTNGFEKGWCFKIACRVSFEVSRSACFHMMSFNRAYFLKWVYSCNFIVLLTLTSKVTRPMDLSRVSVSEQPV